MEIDSSKETKDKKKAQVASSWYGHITSKDTVIEGDVVGRVPELVGGECVCTAIWP